MVKKTNKNSIYAALDIGSSKIACAVGKINNENKMEILGFHFQPTKNVKKGLVINPNEITNEIISIINHISKKTNTEISNIIINANITNSKSKFLKGKVELNGESVNAYNYLYKSIFVPIAGDLNGSLLFAISHVVGFWLVLYWMHRKKIRIKL